MCTQGMKNSANFFHTLDQKHEQYLQHHTEGFFLFFSVFIFKNVLKSAAGFHI